MWLGNIEAKMIVAASIKTKVVVTISGEGTFRLERMKVGSPDWLIWTAAGFGTGATLAVSPGDFIDSDGLQDGVYIYRYAPFTIQNPEDKDYGYSNPVRCGTNEPTGYTFGNYTKIPGTWGEIVTEDDIRFTYLWGTDFKATNGQSYTDAQIKFFIDASLAALERQLNITIKKQRIRCMPERRGLEKGLDYDVEEAYYDFKLSRIQRYGMITTRARPIIKVHRLNVINRFQDMRNILDKTVIDKKKGLLKLLERPIRPSETSRGIQTAVSMYGNETINSHLFYEVDYDAGYETSDDIPMDLREIIGKNAAISLLNIIGDGLMSGFSSSSLSMDGISESFSSTQSATSAYFGARVQVYKDDIEKYVEANKHKFGHIPIGAL
jgi:hypothetical protein